ncbi:unnamed protein product [Paramecium primaurelia]|uniref:thioredoxin-dependent peroxiredoxin n=2 Tax=Paramecium TaxID=5884 RepID=A0A8S1XVF7_9CILI|nr:unnamed protein product [Paramecium primaurelia]CAD8204552.1 unnamed protein product [Paramecium pentaurelia]
MSGKAIIQKAAPFFKTNAWNSTKNAIEQVQLTDFKGKYLLLFFYPLNFTFVCPTEIIQFSKLAKQFRENNCEVLGCSVDSVYSHAEYVKKPKADGGLGGLDILLLSDLTKQISSDYGVLTDSGLSLRGTFLIDGNQNLRHASINDAPVGRNVDEYLRLLQAFQFVEKHGEVCPASWKPGQATIKPDIEKSKTYWQNTHAKN